MKATQQEHIFLRAGLVYFLSESAKAVKQGMQGRQASIYKS